MAAQIHSATGHPEPARTSFEDNAEYEQVTTARAAEILGCTERNVRRLAEHRRLPGVKNGKSWYFNRDDVEVYRDYK
nr:helix-turn-helix domain-containing protein [Corynebacterium parakroppenstedtii]